MVVQTEHFNYMRDPVLTLTSDTKFKIVQRIQAAEESDRQAMTSTYAVSLRLTDTVKNSVRKEVQQFGITFTDELYQDWLKEYQQFKQNTFSWGRVPLVGRLIRWYKTISDDTITTFGSGLGGFLTGAAGGGAIANYLIIPAVITIAAAAGVSLTIPGVGVMAIIGISALIIGCAATLISIKIAHYAKKRQNDHITNIIGAVQQEQERVQILELENVHLKQEIKTLQSQLSAADEGRPINDPRKTEYMPKNSLAHNRFFPQQPRPLQKDNNDIAAEFDNLLEYHGQVAGV